MSVTQNDSIILEFRPIGSALAVAAIDEKTGLEVRFSAPARTPRSALEQLARRKLNYVQNAKP